MITRLFDSSVNHGSLSLRRWQCTTSWGGARVSAFENAITPGDCIIPGELDSLLSNALHRHTLCKRSALQARPMHIRSQIRRPHPVVWQSTTSSFRSISENNICTWSLIHRRMHPRSAHEYCSGTFRDETGARYIVRDIPVRDAGRVRKSTMCGFGQRRSGPPPAHIALGVLGYITFGRSKRL